VTANMTKLYVACL